MRNGFRTERRRRARYSPMRKRALSAILLPLLVIPALVRAQSTSQFEGKPIVAIEYDPADQPLTAAQLEKFQLLKTGQPLRRDDVSAAIDRLFSTGRYTDVQVDVQPRGDGVAVRFLTKKQFFVGHVGAEGKLASPPNFGQVVDAAQLTLGRPYVESDVEKAEAAIKTLFQRNGLYEATVTHRLIPSPTAEQMTIIFEVETGKRARYDDPVITGDPKLPAKDIVKATGWRRFMIGGWRYVTEVRTRNGIAGVQKKYQKKERLMAKVQLKSLDYDAAQRRAKPTLDVQAGPKIAVKTVEAKVSKGKLRSLLPIYDEQSVDRDLLVEGARNLRDYLQSQGYYETDVDFRETPRPEQDELMIEYVIAKGARHKLVAVSLDGNKYFDDQTLKDRLLLRPASFPALRHGRYSDAYKQRDEQDIADLYRSNGFRDVKVTSSVADDFKGKSGDIAVTYHIEEGPQWFIDSLDVAGMNAPLAADVRSAFSSSAGQPFSEYNVAADRKILLDHYFSLGYFSAQFSWSFTPSGQPNRVNLRYEIKEGDEHFARDVLLGGLETTREKLVRDNLRIHAGDPLSPLNLTETQRRLYNLGVFAKVNMAVQNPEGATLDKYVLYDMEEASRYTVRVGVGAEIAKFGPSTNDLSTPTGNAGFSPRFSLDLSRLNFLGIGHTLSLQGRISNLERRALFNYFAPRFQSKDGRSVTFTALYDFSRDVRTFTSQREEASIQLSQQFSKPTSGLFRFAYRRVSTSNVNIPALLVPQLLQAVRIGILSVNLIQDRRDDPANTRRGIFNTIDLGLASNAFGSQRNFARVLGRNATYTPIGKRFVFARQLTVGAILPFNTAKGFTAADYVPLPERFFAGGGNSLRAFSENQAGPRDLGTPAGAGAIATQPTGFPLGGNAVFIHNSELRFPLSGENIGGVLFHDMGNVFRDFSGISFRLKQRNAQDFNYMVHAAGFGIRYRTPVGPVRVDLAYSINPPTFTGFKGTYRQLLACNPNKPDPTLKFCNPVQQTTGHFQFFFSIGQTF